MKVVKYGLIAVLIIFGSLLVACSSPEVIVKEEVTKVVVEKVVETAIVVETVVVEGTPQVVEKEVTKLVEVEKVVTATPEPADAIKRGGILAAAISADPEGLDPHVTSAYSSFEVLINIYNTLVGADENLNITPMLAESWEVSDDNLTWTFHLREGVKWHNGRELTADDVIYSYERILDPETGSGNAWHLSLVDSMEAPNDLDVVIHLSAPSPNLLAMLAGPMMSIVPKEIVDDGTISTHPIGTGAFRFVEYVPGDHVTLEANPDYWEKGLPYVDGVVFKPIPDETVRVTNLLAGEVDWVDGIPPSRVTEMATSGEVIVGKVNAGDYWYIGVNTTRKPFDDVRVRQAIAYAIDRKEVTEAAMWDIATANQGPIPSNSFWYNDYQPYDQDLDKARQLLAEAGYPNGFDTEFMPTTAYEETVRAAQVLQAQLSQIGINAEIRTLEWTTWLQEEGEGNFDMYLCGWLNMYDPDQYFYSQHHSGEIYNFTGYSNPKADELMEAGRVETDLAARKAIYDELQKIIIDDSPYIYLYNPAKVHAWQPYVRGYVVYGDGAIHLKSVWLQR